ncbi:hypothetical protein ACH518_06760 [Methylomonas sp. HW2-6]|uniref:hypothetical protein n=1 Tax=Methylomonas sp. HW2-6 TaxID=3376687 RepID=UPI004042CE58
MPISEKQLWQEVYRRLELIQAETPVSQTTIDSYAETWPDQLADETAEQWFGRARRLAQVIPFRPAVFQPLTEIRRLAADTLESEFPLPSAPLLSQDQQFRLTIQALADDKLQLTLETLGIASHRYAHCVLGIAAADSKSQLICAVRLNADGEGVDSSLQNTPAIRKALVNPVIALIESSAT